MTTPITDNFESHIINELMLAQKSIKIAVAWFNSKNILNILSWKLRGGIKVELILQYDNINIGNASSLDFTEYNQLGGILIWAKSENSTMHVKFCVIDDKVLLHGSCNWTYRAFNKNDEVLNVTKDESKIIDSYLCEFSSLKEKYTSPTISQRRIGYATKKRKNNISKDERIRSFVEDMNKYDIQRYSCEYIKTFMDYWTGYSNDYTKYFFEQRNWKIDSLKMRFEEKPDFVMKLELEDWGRILLQMKEEEEYKKFCNTFVSEASEAYEKYCKCIDDASPWPNFNNRLEQLHEEIEKKGEIYKNTRLKDIFPKWSDRKGKNTVYDYLLKHHLPIIITTSNVSGIVHHQVQFGVYSYKKEPYIATGAKNSAPSWWQSFRGISTIKCLENYFHCTLLEYVEVPERMQRLNFKDYTNRYIESCVFNSRFKYKLKNDGNEKILTKERLRLLLEAAYVIKIYHKRKENCIQKYGQILIGDILKGDEFSLVKDITIGEYLSHCPLIELDLEYNIDFPRDLFVHVNTGSCGRKSLYPDVIIPGINDALNISIDYSEKISEYIDSKSYYVLSNDVYYTRDDFRFLSLEEVCEFDETKIKFKPSTWYYKEIMSW